MQIGRIKTKVTRIGRIDARGALTGRKTKLKVKRGKINKEIIALVNSGYEAETPQLLIPIHLAKEVDMVISHLADEPLINKRQTRRSHRK